MAGSNNRYPEINNAVTALQKMKMEIATELGVPDYDKIDKGMLPARVHGKIGGNMVRRMVSEYERIMSDPANANMINQSNQVADAQLAQDKPEVEALVNASKQLS